MLSTYGTWLIIYSLQNKKIEIIIIMWITTYEISMKNVHHKLYENTNEKADSKENGSNSDTSLQFLCVHPPEQQ